MIAERKTRVIHMEYWACLNPNHYHNKQDVAQRCIDSELNKPKKIVIDYRTRNKELVLTLLGGDETFSSIARKYDISSHRVGQIVRQQLRKARNWHNRKKLPLPSVFDDYGYYNANVIYENRARILNAYKRFCDTKEPLYVNER